MSRSRRSLLIGLELALAVVLVHLFLLSLFRSYSKPFQWLGEGFFAPTVAAFVLAETGLGQPPERPGP